MLKSIDSINKPSISTPYRLDDAIKELEDNSAEVKLVTPSQDVFNKLNELGGNTVDPSIRPEIAKLGEAQGRKDAEMIKQFWNE